MSVWEGFASQPGPLDWSQGHQLSPGRLLDHKAFDQQDTGRAGLSPLPDTPAAARDVFEREDFVIAFSASSKLPFMIISACLKTTPHLTC